MVRRGSSTITSRTISAARARADFAAVLDAAASGEPVLIIRRSTIAAAVISPDDYNLLKRFKEILHSNNPADTELPTASTSRSLLASHRA